MEAAKPAPSPSPIERILFISAFVSYAFCLFAPAFTANGSAHPGWVAIAMSPLGLKLGYLAALANPVLWYAWIAKARRKHANAGIASTTALALALSFLVQERIFAGMPENYSSIVRYGYYLWLLSMALTAASAFIAFSNEPRKD